MTDGIYITGAGIISAIGCGIDATRDALASRRSGVRTVEILPTVHRELPCGEVAMTDDQLRQHLGIAADAPGNRTALMGIEAMRQAVEQAGINAAEAWLVSGTTVGGMDRTERHFLEMIDSNDHLKALATHDSGSTTELTASYFGIPNDRTTTISTACSSAANALIVGANMIKAGKADIVVAGGSEALSLFHLNGFNSLMILDSERCRPFDSTRRGLNLGEGAAYVVLESRRSVEARQARPLARLSGYGNKCDAYHQTASSADGEGAYLAMREALAMASLQPLAIGYVNAHGTGTVNNDASESAALTRVFGEAMPPVSSTKPFTGHTTSASGSIETVISLIALNDGLIPANLGWSTPADGCIIPTEGQTGAEIDHVMCNSFGFGGNDSSLILSKVGVPAEASEPWTDCKIAIAAEVESTPQAPLDNLREFMKPMESRRLSALLKSALMTSLTALRDAAVDTPDAIIVGTTYGMLENSEKFLLQMLREGEQTLSPTLFMQSTHNTIAGTLAIRTHCHGYNITYTQPDRQSTLDRCLADARMLISQGKARTVLVGYHNEVTPLLADMLLRLTGKAVETGVTSVAMVVRKED